MKIAQMNDQPGWELTGEDSDEGNTTQKSQFNCMIYRIICNALINFGFPGGKQLINFANENCFVAGSRHW
jgi:hypothetical protein